MTRASMRVRCACGWETSGSEEAVVAATQDHGRRIHHMRASREEVLAMAVREGPTREERPSVEPEA
jgi:predicted small metal-binding protein